MNTTDKIRNGLCAAFRDLTEAVGGANRAAKITGLSPGMISKYCHPHHNEMARSDVIAIMEADCGDPIVTRALAELSGWTIVQAMSVAPADALVSNFSEVAKDSGAALSTVGQGMADGRFDAKDAKAALPAMRELVESATNMAEQLETLSESTTVVDFRQTKTA